MAESDRFASLEREYEEVLSVLSEPDVAADRKRFLAISRRHKELEPIVRTILPSGAGEGTDKVPELTDLPKAP